jgi:hypothetical protein
MFSRNEKEMAAIPLFYRYRFVFSFLESVEVG